MKLVVIGCTHTLHDNISLPDGDVLIHTGSFCKSYKLNDLCNFNRWLRSVKGKFKKIIVIAGRSDKILEKDPKSKRFLMDVDAYLLDSSFSFKGIKFYGSPWSAKDMKKAFELDHKKLKEKWDLIPNDVDCLITHTPPYGILDKPLNGFHLGQSNGDGDLMEKVSEIKPQVHVFSLIHGSYGSETKEGTIYANVSSCNTALQPINPPIVIEIKQRVKEK